MRITRPKLACLTLAAAISAAGTATAGTLTPSVQGVPATPGVIIPPPSVDPGMVTTPAPQAGTTPVIPPPGTPGSGSPVQPK